MSYEIWTRNAYGHQFGQPLSKIEGELTAEQVAGQLRNAAHGPYLLHQLCIVQDAEVTEAGRWLKDYEKDRTK